MDDSQIGQSAEPAMAGCSQVLIVPRCDRWPVFRRLQELEIPCTYHPENGLRVEAHHPTHAIQVWSVLRQFNTPRPQLAQWLQQCWQR